jgi:hypothetical protein
VSVFIALPNAIACTMHDLSLFTAEGFTPDREIFSKRGRKRDYCLHLSWYPLQIITQLDTLI